MIPRVDIEYELRLVNPYHDSGSDSDKNMPFFLNAIILVRTNMCRNLVHGQPEAECCHGWLCDADKDDLRQLLRDIERFTRSSQKALGISGQTLKIKGTVLTLEKYREAELKLDRPPISRKNTMHKGGAFSAASSDTRSLRAERGLWGLMDWKVMYVHVHLEFSLYQRFTNKMRQQPFIISINALLGCNTLYYPLSLCSTFRG